MRILVEANRSLTEGQNTHAYDKDHETRDWSGICTWGVRADAYSTPTASEYSVCLPTGSELNV